MILSPVKYRNLQLNKTSASVFWKTDYDNKKSPHIFITIFGILAGRWTFIAFPYYLKGHLEWSSRLDRQA